MGRCAIAFITILLSPVGVLLEKGPGIDFLINLVLFVVLLDIGGIIHAFHVYGVPLCTNLLCLLLPPFGVFCSHGYSGEFCVSVLLTLFGFFPGVIYAYFVNLQLIENESKGRFYARVR